MFLITKLKALFKKELSSILAPLDKIHDELEAFLDKAGAEINANIKKVNEINFKNEAIKAEQAVAITIKSNVRTLLGKL